MVFGFLVCAISFSSAARALKPRQAPGLPQLFGQKPGTRVRPKQETLNPPAPPRRRGDTRHTGYPGTVACNARGAACQRGESVCQSGGATNNRQGKGGLGKKNKKIPTPPPSFLLLFFCLGGGKKRKATNLLPANGQMRRRQILQPPTLGVPSGCVPQA